MTLNPYLRALMTILALNGIVAPMWAVGPFVVHDSDFVGGIYDFHYYTQPNSAPAEVSKRTIINGVDQGITDPTMTSPGWEFGDGIGHSVGYWAAIGISSATNIAGEITMGWDLSAVSNRIVKVELKTRHYLFQQPPHTEKAIGDTIAAFVSTPESFGAGPFSQIYSYTGNGDSSQVVLGSGGIIDLTSSLSGTWLENPGRLELKFTYTQIPNPTIPGRHIQIFRDNTGMGDDAFVLRLYLEGATGGGNPAVTLSGSGSAFPGALVHLEAEGTDCVSGNPLTGWVWNAPDATIHGYSTTRTLVVSWASPGTRTVTVSNPDCGAASASKQVTVSPGEPRIQVWPGASYMYQPVGTALGRTAYSINNYGSEPATVSVESDGTFFTQSPGTVTIAPGAWERIEVRGKDVAEGLHRKRTFFSGDGLTQFLIENGQLVQLLVFSNAPTDGEAVPERNRVDVTGMTASARFRNSGTLPLHAQVFATKPWIVPARDEVTIAPGATSDVDFTIDGSLRPDAAEPSGSVTGEIGLQYETTAAGAKSAERTTSQGATVASLVTIVDTVPPPTAPGVIPPLGANEVALFVPGIGHIAGSVGTFISDLSMVNLTRDRVLDDLRLYFNPQPGSAGAGSQVATVAALAPGSPAALADIVSTAFTENAQLGSLQIRSSSIDSVGIVATVFNSSNPAGTYGTTIPVLRSDRGAKPGERVNLTGLRSDATHHTNIFIQEMSGTDVTVKTDFLSPTGVVLGSRSDTVGAFGLVQRGAVVPAGAVSAVLTNTGSAGSFFAYATPVDRASGDTWAVSDWPRQLGYSGGEAAVIPVAGALKGANDTFFRTDLSIMNTGTTVAQGELRYVDRNGPIFSESISIPAGETRVLDDVTNALFGITSDTVGYMTWTPSSGEVVITSRNFTTIEAEAATFGSGVPTLAAGASLRPGELIRFGGVEDATLETISLERPATFRTNFGLVETSGNAVKVRVTVRYDVASTLASERASASKEFDVPANGLLLVSNLGRSVIGEGREEIVGDLRNLEVDFELSAGDGRIAVFTSSVDNGTGDSILTQGTPR